MSRYVIFGAGAVGGVVGARLHQAGHEVALIARGAHLEAIRRDGLTLTTPVEEITLPIPAAADPAQLGVGARDDDVVLLAVKSQDTSGALRAIRPTGADVPIVCLQNGVDNERSAARRFGDVYGAVVIAPDRASAPGGGPAPTAPGERDHRHRPLSRGGRRALRGAQRGAVGRSPSLHARAPT